jgi:glucose-1-phosphate thymidylyltransferase
MTGQSDAFWQAREFLHGPMLMAFSDTLIENDFSFLPNEQADGVAWVKPVPDPRRFGVAEVDKNGWVTRLIEKPPSMDNNLVVVGCYYFREAEELISAIKAQTEQDLSLKGEFYLADAINILLARGFKMRTETVDTWLDAGTTDAIIKTNRYLMDHGRDNNAQWADLVNCQIIPPVNLHPSAQIRKSVIGPHVSLGEGAVIADSVIKNAIIGSEATITNCKLEASLIGSRVTLSGLNGKFNLGDDSQAEG